MLLTFNRDTFAHKIINGVKLHSIRQDAGRRWKVGRQIDFWRGNPRNVHNMPYKFGVGRCCHVSDITIDLHSKDVMNWRIESEVSPYLNPIGEIEFGRMLWLGARDGLEPFTMFAINDGFVDAFEMKEFFPAHFQGRIIVWENFVPLISLEDSSANGVRTGHGNILLSTSDFAKLNTVAAYRDFTAIHQFEVVKPRDELETEGEILELSIFGEYCPPQSLRGYKLEELLSYPLNYRPLIIFDRGQPVRMIKK